MKPWPDNLKTNWLKESVVRREQIKGWLKRNAPVEFGFIEYFGNPQSGEFDGN